MDLGQWYKSLGVLQGAPMSPFFFPLNKTRFYDSLC